MITPAGTEVLKKAERLEVEAVSLERDVGGRDSQMAGLVRVTCPESIASHVLAPCLAALRTKHPEIMVELIPDSRELSLSKREADVSLRLTPSSQHDYVMRRIGTLTFGLYAGSDYLLEYGNPNADGGCPGHYLVTQLDDLENAEQTGWLAAVAARARISLQTSSHEAAVVAAVHGGGLACLACFRADREARLVRLATSKPVPDTGLWLVYHKDNRRNARIRAVLTQISEWVRSISDQLDPARNDRTGT